MKKVFACLSIMAVFPLVASPTWDNSNNPAPFATVVLAGHKENPIRQLVGWWEARWLGFLRRAE